GKAEGLESGLSAVVDGGDPEDVLAEYKYDGVRAQIHVDGDEVRVFTRRLDDVTEQFPDVVRAVREGVDEDGCIVEAELVGYDPETGDAVPFQRLSRRIRRTEGIDRMAEQIPVVAYLFDAVYVDGETLFDLPLGERLDRLDGAFEATERALEPARRLFGPTLDEAEALYEDALAAGHEGVVLKNLAASYQPGTRVGYVTKVKPTMEPLDLVVVGAEWSQGRKSDWLGRLHLACRVGDASPGGNERNAADAMELGGGTDGDDSTDRDDENDSADRDDENDTADRDDENGVNDERAREAGDATERTIDGYAKVGRMFSGLTDEQLVEMTERLEPLVTEDRGKEVVVRPEVVVEVEYEAIQSSPRYETGFALRFPRFLGFRDDLAPEDADSLSKVRELYEEQ
ncbi:hypothetical protein ACFQE1_14930, partial [Halobium palmae]